MNKVILVGNISTNIELRKTKEDKSVATFNLAVSRIGEGTDFLPIVVWGKQADNLKEYQQKGSKILVEGRIQTRNYTDEKGNKHYITEIIGEVVQYLSPKEKVVEKANKGANNPYEDFGKQVEMDMYPEESEGLPF